MFLGPLFRFELVRLARRGTHLPLRVVLCAVLLVGLLATYVRQFPNASPTAVLFSGVETAVGTELQAFGEHFLVAFLWVQQVTVLLLTPVYAGGAIAEEKEKGRMDFLLTTPLGRWELVMGKLAARLLFVLWVMIGGLPVLLATLLFGGVDPPRVLAGFTVGVISAVAVGAFAVMLSVLRHTLRDVLLWVFGLLVLSAIAALIFACFTPGGSGAVVSPVTVFVPLFNIWEEKVPATGDPTWGLVGVYAALDLTFAAGCVLVTVANVRTAAERTTVVLPTPDPEPPAPPPPPLEPSLPEWYRLPEREVFAPDEVPAAAVGRGFLVPPLGDREDPLRWKERHFGGRLPLLEGQWYTVVRGCLVAAFVFALGVCLFVGTLISMASDRWPGAVVNAVARVALVGVVVVLPFAGVRAAVGVAEERAKGTLDSLLALPLDRADLLTAKWKAAAARSRVPLITAGVVLAVAMCTGGIHPAGAVAAAVLIAGFVTFCVGLGVWLSVRCHTPVRAVLWFLAVVVAVAVGPLVLAPLCCPPLDSFCPPYGLWLATGWTIDGEEMGVNRGSAVVNVVTGLAAGGVYAAAGVGFWRAAVRRFEREGRR